MFERWDSYFLLIGSAAAALIGLLFVVATLTSGRDRESALRGAGVYITPVVFHFAVVVVVSAMAMVPDLGARGEAAIAGASALIGLGVAGRVSVVLGQRKLLQPPHWSDVWCYGIAPAAIYLALAAMAAAVWVSAPWGPYGVAAALLALLLAGIRNAWDLVTWMAPRAGPDELKPPPAA